jgi:SecD/SecF fusion protein
MGKQRKWQFLLILTVVISTIYNILPTVFYYLKPLKQPISVTKAENISASIVNRLNSLEKDTVDWIHSYCNLIHTKPLNISINLENPQWVNVAFATAEEALRFRNLLPRAGLLISFAPAQLTLGPINEEERHVQILRKIPTRIEKEDFTYFVKNNRQILESRIEKLLQVLTGPSDTAVYLNSLQR